MKKKVLIVLTTFVITLLLSVNVSMVKNVKEKNLTLYALSNIANADSEGGGGGVTCYWTYKTGLFANWHIMTCYSCKPEEVKEFRDKGDCSL